MCGNPLLTITFSQLDVAYGRHGAAGGMGPGKGYSFTRSMIES